MQAYKAKRLIDAGESIFRFTRTEFDTSPFQDGDLLVFKSEGGDGDGWPYVVKRLNDADSEYVPRNVQWDSLSSLTPLEHLALQAE